MKFSIIFVWLSIIFSGIIFLSENININNSTLIDINLNNKNIISRDPVIVQINNIFNKETFDGIKNDYKKIKNFTNNKIFFNSDLIFSNIIYSKNLSVMYIFHSDIMNSVISEISNESVTYTKINHPYSNIISLIKNSLNTKLNLYQGKTYFGIYTILNNSESCFNNKCFDTLENSLLVYDSEIELHNKKNLLTIEYITQYTTNISQNFSNLLNKYLFTDEGPISMFYYFFI